MSFYGKIVWITGASSGIGEALAYAFAEEGARLVISSRRREALEKVREKAQNSSDVLVLPLDLSDISQMEPAVKKVKEQFGRIDILINNGGVSQRGNVMETPLDVERQIMEVNFFGTVALTKSVLPIMERQKDGHVVVISSILGKFAIPGRATYCASKHALQGYFGALEKELEKKKIKVSLICPGFIRTNVSKNAVTSDGTSHDSMDDGQAGGMSAEECARDIIKAVKKNRSEVYIGGKEILMVYLKRYVPSIFNSVVRKRVNKPNGQV